jgi:quercetin dioxygenase-like cupin family protein
MSSTNRAFGDFRASDPVEIWSGVVGWTIDGERVTLSLIELEPSTVVPEHAHENEQIGMLLRGSLTFRIDDEERALEVGGTWRIRSGTPHEVRTGPEGATVVEAFAPVRIDWDGLERTAERRPSWPPDG